MDSFETRCVKHKEVEGRVTSLSTPIFASSTFQLDSIEHGDLLCNTGGDFVSAGSSNYLYSRLRNPTVDVAENSITQIEGGHGTVLFGSGMAAISSTLLAFLKAGDTIIMPYCSYGGTNEVSTYLLEKRLGVNVVRVDARTPTSYIEAAKSHPGVRVLYGELISNPRADLLDMEAFVLAASTLKDVVTIVDNTFATAYNKALIPEYGVDVVINSCTKYYGGHSDILAGSVTCKKEEHTTAVRECRTITGSCASPFDAFLLLRGLKTLHLRMQRHNE
mmetsp:Transcript_28137/g.71726  ORF Transcript_28137/g.71726 Transcript_28137/m.71726 type:complete len:276 (+) Transcript_28137:60-887(+)